MAAVAPIAAVAAIASAGATAYGAYETGKGQQAADEYQAGLLKQKAQYAGAAAAETNATLTDRLATTLGNIDVVRAAAHADPTSPTTLALKSRASDVGNQERAIRVGNILAQQTEDLYGATYETSAGNFALQMGELTAGTDVLKTIGQTNPNLFGAGGSLAGISGDPLAGLNATTGAPY